MQGEWRIWIRVIISLPTTLINHITTSYETTIRSYLVTAKIVLSYILCHHSVIMKEKIVIKTVREVGVLSHLTTGKCALHTYPACATALLAAEHS